MLISLFKPKYPSIPYSIIAKSVISKKILKNNSGMTVIEMLTAMFVFSLIMGGAVYLLSQIYKNYGFSMEQGMSVNSVQHSLKIMVEEIRGACQSDGGAYPIQEADDNDFTFFSDIDEDGITERIHYYKENESIKKGVSRPSGTPAVYPIEDEEVTTISEHVVNTALEPLFLYYNTNYPADQVNNPLSAPVSPLMDIRLVKIDLNFNLDPNRAPDNIRLESFIELRNLKDNW